MGVKLIDDKELMELFEIFCNDYRRIEGWNLQYVDKMDWALAAFRYAFLAGMAKGVELGKR